MMLMYCMDMSNYDENDKTPLPTGKNKKLIGLLKDELGGRIIMYIQKKSIKLH